MPDKQRTDAPRLFRRRASFRLRPNYTRDQKLFIWEAMFMYSANVITTGMFLTGLLLMMGADNMTVGLVISSGSWSMLLSLVASVVMERVRDRKRLLTWVIVIFRLLTTLPAFLPAVMGTGGVTVAVTFVMVVLGNAVFSLYNTGFTVFFMDSIPAEGRTNYIYNRLLLIRIAYTVLLVAMGFVLDLFTKVLGQGYLGLVLVFGIALAVGVADVIAMSRIKGVCPPPDGPRAKIGDLLKGLLKPLGDRRYLRYLAFSFAFFFFLSISTAFTSLYQIKYLQLSYGFISIYNMAIYITMIAMTRTWGKIEQRIGRPNLIITGMVLIAAELLFYGFLTKNTLWLLSLTLLCNSLGNSSYWACNLPYRYDLMPEEGKMAYEGWFWFVYGSAGLLGALLGGSLQYVIPEAHTPVMTFSVFQLLYLLSGVTAVGTALAYRSGLRRDGAVGQGRGVAA